jgi:hypothetical protein
MEWQEMVFDHLFVEETGVIGADGDFHDYSLATKSHKEARKSRPRRGQLQLMPATFT